MKRSKIPYCDFSSGDLNIVTGCTKVSEGCRFCWAEAIYKRFGRDFSVVKTHPDKLRRLRRPSFECFGNKRSTHEKPISRPIAFVCDTGDLLHGDVPDEFILEALAMMLDRRDVTWLVLTKRAQRLYEIMDDMAFWLEDAQHVWVGVSAENQRTFDNRWSWLDNTSVSTKWISVEPMLGPIDLGDARPDWIVCGAESGPNRRPFDVAWAADLKRQCDERGIAFFGKQDSGFSPGVPLLIDGREWKAWPQ